MIKCEVVFDGDEMLVSGKTIYITGGVDGHICCSVDRSGFLSLIDAVAYCMEQSDEN